MIDFFVETTMGGVFTLLVALAVMTCLGCTSNEEYVKLANDWAVNTHGKAPDGVNCDHHLCDVRIDGNVYPLACAYGGCSLRVPSTGF